MEVCISKEAIADLSRLTAEMNIRVESLELAGDKETMDSYKKSKEQVKKRDFANWNDL